MKIDVAGLDALLEQQRQSLRLPGLSVAVVQHGTTIYQQGLGNAAPDRGVTPQTPLITGSLSKSFTAMAIMQLVEAGKLSLDNPIQHYIPWFRLADPSASACITLRHLLSHTSGISRYVGRELLAGRGGKTIEQSVRELLTLKLSQPVGTTFQYSNINYLIAGLVIEMRSGQPFGAYIEEHIFALLGMQHSHASEQSARQDGLASGYRWWFGLPIPYNAPYLADAVPAAFIASSAEDLARYAMAMLSGGSLDGASVLSPAGIAELIRPQVQINPTASYALGWRIEQWGTLPILRHGGEVSNFLSEIVLVPSQHLAVVVLMNANNGMLPLAIPAETKLASSITRFLLDMPSVPHRLSLRTFSLLLDGILAGLFLFQGWSLLSVLRGKRRTNRRWPMLIELGSLALAGYAIPRLADAPWTLLWMYVPDMSAWLLAFSGVSVLKWTLAFFTQTKFLLPARR